MLFLGCPINLEFFEKSGGQNGLRKLRLRLNLIIDKI